LPARSYLEIIMATLTIPQVDEELVQRLRKHASAAGISVEDAHRQLLQTALSAESDATLHDYLQQMPNVGDDCDFEISRQASAPVEI
jgi:plasmid stability protein